MPTTSEAYAPVLLALCIWREARGQSRDVKVAIKHVILNRAARPKGPYADCRDVVANILRPYQFSSFNGGDPNAAKLPDPRNAADWAAWLECCSVVDGSEPDPTGGANHYFDDSITPPKWADSTRLTAHIGAMRFYRL